MYKYSPKRKNNLAPTLAGLGFLLAIILFCLPIETYKGFFQLLALMCATVGVFITANNLLVSYLYRIESDAENPELYILTINRIQGKKITTVARLSSTDIVLIEKFDRKKPRPKGTRLYNYCVDMRPDAFVLWLTDENEGVLIMPDETMLSLLGYKE